jgi:hypothetical protein
MRHALLGTILLLTATTSRADHRPALTWEGQVDGTAILRIQGDRVDVDNRSGSVSGANVRMTTPLPDYAERINVESRQGGARVRVLEQPSRANNFTALVRVDSQRRGPQFISLDFFWDDRSNSARYDRNNSRDRDTRYGDDRYADDRDRSDTYRNRDSGTRSRRDDQYDPNDRAYSNGGVLSPNGGYSDNSRYNAGVASGGARWTGQVDDRIRVMFRGNRAWSQRISGQQVYGEQASFATPLPRANVDVSVNKLRGRGDVQIVERPSPANNYTLVVEIDDKDGGADTYDLELNWR